MSERSARRKKARYTFSDESDSSDEDWVEKPKSGKRGRSSDDDYSWGQPKNPRKSSGEKARHIGIGTMAVNATPQFVKDISPDDLKHSPAGEACRFVEFDEIKDCILKPEKYLKPGETGINTFIPNFKPENPDKLPYFGYQADLITTDLNVIAEFSDEALDAEIEKINKEIEKYETNTESNCTIIPAFSQEIKNSIAIRENVMFFNFEALGKKVQFDVITMDPPWVLAQSTITRGVALQYDQLDNEKIASMPIHYIQKNGYIFVWVIACQLGFGIQLLKRWGYEFVCPLNWTKVSRYGRYMPSHGYYLQHNKETLLIGRKGVDPDGMRADLFSDLIVEQRGLRQSHKPVDIYELIERVFPNCMYLEIFARPHNLREGWVSMGIELPK